MKKIKAIIVDDEASARDILENILVKFIPDVEVLAKCDGVPSAVKAIEEHSPHVVFLDIEMRKFNGFELLDFVKEVNFDIIFVTAYNKYALQAFEVSAVDYLLKPLQIDSVEHAVDKVRKNVDVTDSLARINNLKENIEGNSIKKIAINMSDGTKFIAPSDIIYLHAAGAYTQMFRASDKKLTVSKKIKFFEEILQTQSNFIRIHRSFMINTDFIKSYSKANANVTLEDGTELKVARERKEAFESTYKH